jgi:hypothetical protein
MNVFCRVAVGQYRERGAVANAKLPINPVQMDLYGAFGESKPLRYFLVAQAFRHYPNDLAFARGERFTLMVSYPGYFL